MLVFFWGGFFFFHARGYFTYVARMKKYVPGNGCIGYYRVDEDSSPEVFGFRLAAIRGNTRSFILSLC